MSPSLSIVWVLAQKELRDALRNRWFVLYALAFAVLALAFSYLALASSGLVGFAGFGRTAASLINLVLLIVPLMALTIGAQSIAGEAERGTLAYLLAQPVTRRQVFAGKYLGLALSLLAALALGFGVSGLVMTLGNAAAADPAAYVSLAGLAFLLSLAMLSVGMAVSTWTRKASVAVGVGLFLWLTFVFLGDLGMMGTSIVLRVPIPTLFTLSLLNPTQLFKTAAILTINATLDVLGPAGIYALQRYGDGLLGLLLAAVGVWIVVPALLAYARLAARGEW